MQGISLVGHHETDIIRFTQFGRALLDYVGGLGGSPIALFIKSSLLTNNFSNCSSVILSSISSLKIDEETFAISC